MTLMTPPPIVLDTTLRELYRLRTDGEPRIVLVSIVPSAQVQMKRCMPLGTRYIYQSPLSGPEDSNFLGRIHLQVVAQHYAFMAGRMTVCLVDVDDANAGPNASGLLPTGREEIERVFSHLCPEQQPDVRFVPDPAKLVCPDGFQAAISSPMDCFAHLAHLVNADAHYDLQSKRALAVSGIPTPSAEVIDTKLQPSQACNDGLVAAEVDRMAACVQSRQPPFVLKMQQSLGSQGTIVVRNTDGKEHALEVLRAELGRVLPLLNEANQHLRTSTVLVQDVVAGNAVALSLFVTPEGPPVFISCCEQLLDTQDQWIGGYISYADQDRFRQEYADIAQDVARYSRLKGYRGPLGVDVMTDAEGGRHVAIDVNPRVSGTTPLGVLRGHFSERRGLHHAAVLCPLFLSCTRDEFERAFGEEYYAGSLVITGWSYDAHQGYSTTAVIMAAKTKEELRDFTDRVNAFKLEW
ncbi:solid-state culture-specific protein-like protein [Hypomontagnella submonticulosa]|nr:solid-state culture-specific protein-like protein [Hypomontagnella submonticulosa]